MATDKRAERRQKRRKSAAAGRPANYSQLYKDETKIDGSDGADGSGSDGMRSGKGSESVDWQGEYRHVFRDLRLLLLISLVIFAVMIAGGYFL